MNRNVVWLLGLMLLGGAAPVLMGTGIIGLGSEKKPARAVSVQGSMPYNYVVVETTIMQDPEKIREGETSRPVVTRSVKAKLERGKNVSALADVVLNVPKNPISFDQIGELTQAATKIAGACDPRAGAVAGSVGFILDIGAEVAANALTKCFGNDPLTLTLLEILPSQYYRIDEGNGTVEVTEQFKPDLEKYTQLLDEYVAVAQNWNTAISKYNADYRKWLVQDPLQMDQDLIDNLTQEFNSLVRPALKAKASIEQQLQSYTLHRIAVMAVNTPEGKACGQNGAGSGPWRLYVYYFIGAKQTNIFGVDFCAPSKGSMQDFVVQLVPNSVDVYNNFKPGGVKLAASGKPQAISFPRQVAADRFDYSSPESNLFSWFDEMIINENAASPTSYMFPFDIIAIRNEYDRMLQERHDKNAQARMGMLDGALSVLSDWKAGKAQDKKEREYRESELLMRQQGSGDFDQIRGATFDVQSAAIGKEGYEQITSSTDKDPDKIPVLKFVAAEMILGLIAKVDTILPPDEQAGFKKLEQLARGILAKAPDEMTNQIRPIVDYALEQFNQGDYHDMPVDALDAKCFAIFDKTYAPLVKTVKDTYKAQTKLPNTIDRITLRALETLQDVTEPGL